MRLLTALLILLLSALPASARFAVCNSTKQSAVVALGYFDGTQWASEGWWRILPGSCDELISGPLKARYYYLFATDGAFGNWEGPTRFCVGIFEKFSIAGRGRCKERGMDERGFSEIDTGDHLDWTQRLGTPG